MAYSQRAVNKYHREKYYHIGVNVPERYRAAIQAAASARGVSVSRLVCDVLGRELGLDLALDGTLPHLRKPAADSAQGESSGGRGGNSGAPGDTPET